MKRVLAVAVALFMICPAFSQSKPKAPAAGASDNGERVTKLDEQLADLVARDKGNCDKLGSDVNQFVAKNGKELRQLRLEGQKRTSEQQAAFRQKYGARINAAMDKMNMGISGCANNPKVKDALTALNK